MPITESAVKELKLELTIIHQYEEDDRIASLFFIDLVPRVDFAKQAILTRLPEAKAAKTAIVDGQTQQMFAVIFAVDENGCGMLLFAPNAPALSDAQKACGASSIIGFGEYVGDLP